MHVSLLLGFWHSAQSENGQGVQVAEPSSAYVAAGQSEQLVDPSTAAKVSTGHKVH